MPGRKKRGSVKSASRKSRPATTSAVKTGKKTAKPGRKKAAAKRAARKPSAPRKHSAPRKPYARGDHRHLPENGKPGAKKLMRETTGVDEDLDYGAATRGHRWSRAPAVYVGGTPDRRQGLGRRAADQEPEDSFTRQSDLWRAAHTPGDIKARRNDRRRR